MPLTEPQAKEVWGVLVEHVGAACYRVTGTDRPYEREDFVAYATRVNRGAWRFQGKLGFGGVFYIERQGLRVACYKEDMTPERLAAIDKTNARLAELWETWNGDEPSPEQRADDRGAACGRTEPANG